MGIHDHISEILLTLSNLNWTKIGAAATSIAVIVTSIALITTWYKNWKDKKYKNSEFYLNQIKNYFNNAVELIEEGGNNNIKWHNAIESLKTAVDLSKELTEKPHKHIFVMDYRDAGYKITNIIHLIESPNFFYGTDKHEKIKEIKENENNLSYKTSRISPKKLTVLVRLLYRLDCSQASFERAKYGENQHTWENDFENFSQLIKEENLSGELRGSKVIVDYIRDFDNKAK
jgi:hypothetical protein